MLENKRTYKRFDLPLIVKFRPAPGTSSYSLGLAKNLSCEGIGLEARNFDFTLKENLEMELKLPQNAGSVSLLGDVVWKRRDGLSIYAGIEFRVQDPKKHTEMMEKITSYTNIPLVSAYYSKRGDKDIQTLLEEKPVLIQTGTGSVETHDIKAAETIPAEKSRELGFIKEYINEGRECKVSFLFPQEAAPDAGSISIVGDFNDWDISASPMFRDENGDFRITLDLSGGKEYRFKYLIDGSRWENDWLADKYVANAFGSDDSVLIV